MRLTKYAAATAALIGAAQAVRPVVVKGQDFVDSVTNKRLVIIGVDYQPGGQGGYKPQDGEDPLSNGDVCLRDAILLQSLGVNTIRVYNVDPTINHDLCASIFNAAGIYMLIDVNSPFGGESIDRSNPGSSYHEGYLARIFGVVEAFKDFKNTLAFFGGNEIINDLDTAQDNPKYIRAVQRDLHNYIANHASRPIPVGYSAADVREVLQDTWAYLQCAIDGNEDDLTRSDLFGLNSYSWCGPEATFETAQYDKLVEMFGNSTVPVFFSEYGCNEVKPRVFNEVQALYGKEMTSLSGGLVYEYSQEPSDYGLVVINDDGSINLRVDFDNLQGQYLKLDIGLLESTDSTAVAIKPPKCDKSLIINDAFDANFTIPKPPPGAQDLIDNGIPNPPVGKFVEVTKTASPNKVFNKDGVEITGLTLKILGNDDANVPNPTIANLEATATKKSAGSTNFRVSSSALLAVAVAALFLV